MSDDTDIILPSDERAALALCDRLDNEPVEDLYGYAAVLCGQMLGEASETIRALLHERDALRTLLKGVRDSLHCTKQAPFSYDANHHCSYCGTTLAYSKEAIDAALAAKEKP